VSIFDPNAILNSTITDANSTVAVPVPAGEFLAFLEELKIEPWQSKDDPTKAGLSFQGTWNIDDAGVKAQLERDKVTVRQQFYLDLTESGGLDMGKGKNVQLGKLREAFDMNKPGEPFSIMAMQGRPAKIVVAHRVNPKNTEQIFAEVKAVARVS
jgi:hypothetical protein